MPKRTSHSPAGKGVLAILLLCVLGGGVLAAYVKLSPQAFPTSPKSNSGTPEVSVQAQTTETPATTQSGTTALLVPEVYRDDVRLNKPVGEVPEGEQPEVYLINQTLASLQVPDAKALGVDVHDGLATVSFNPEIQKGYGTMEEGFLIKGLRMALGQFKEIDKFEIAVEGKPVDSLGNIDLSSGVDVIRPRQLTPDGPDSRPINP